MRSSLLLPLVAVYAVVTLASAVVDGVPSSNTPSNSVNVPSSAHESAPPDVVESPHCTADLTDLPLADPTSTSKLPLSFWRELLTLPAMRTPGGREPGYLVRLQDLACNFTTIPSLECSSEVHLDYFPVHIGRLPPDVSLRTLFHLVRSELAKGQNSSILDVSIASFEPYDTDNAALWVSANPLGALLHIDMYASGINVEDATVMVAEHHEGDDHCYWTFSTVSTFLVSLVL